MRRSYRHFRHAYYSHGGSHGGWGSSGGGYAGGGSSGGYAGGWGSSGGGYGGWGSSGGGYAGGSHGGWSGGSTGGWSGGSDGGWAGGDGEWGVMGGSEGGHVIEGAPMEGEVEEGSAPSDAAPAPEGAEDAPPPGGSTFIPAGDSVALTVEVPADAKVFVNGMETKSRGAVRRFVSRGLEGGLAYSYEIRAELTVDGETRTESKLVKLHGGQTAQVAFGLNAAQSTENVAEKPEPTRTTLLLRVPSNARVFLAGKQTSATGELREFSTTRLASQNAWANYPVRVEYERDGRTLTKEQMVVIRAGETQELSFDFEAREVAQVTR